MSGKHETIVDQCARSIHPAARSQFKDMAPPILAAQWVAPSHERNPAYRVLCGSGMGMPSSGELPDLTFYNMAERDFAADPATHNKFNITAYFRSKDVILLLMAGD